MTTPNDTTEETLNENSGEASDTTDVEPASLEPTVEELAASRDQYRQQAEAYQTVLTAAGIEVGDDGSLNPDQLDAWQSQIQANEEETRRAIVRSSGYDPDSKQGERLVRDLAAGEAPTDPVELRTYAMEYGWTPTAMYTLTEAQQMLAGRRLDALAGASQSTAGDPESTVRRAIGEARERGDFVTASKLQQNFERSQSRGR